eukprot:TRINITY_DN27762_c0_g1_i3.p1 TRINITY_DN27762_c0_g1~~TRINITY_DN27762_c0_g1_i3.p1  ORF type:complete len:267 (+),score=54.30 TRINITY_DN27762_c0_g1_i3:21-821(+)
MGLTSTKYINISWKNKIYEIEKNSVNLQNLNNILEVEVKHLEYVLTNKKSRIILPDKEGLFWDLITGGTYVPVAKEHTGTPATAAVAPGGAPEKVLMPAATLVPTVVVAPAAPLTSPPTVSPTPVQSLPAMADQENVKEGPAGGAGTALERAYCIPFTQFKLSKTPPKKGGGGTVLLATWTGKKVALKTTNNSSSFFFEKELELLCKLSHPNIVRLFGWSQNESLNYIVTEWIPKGNLLEVVCDPNISFDWPLALAFMHDILSGLE